MPPLKIIIVPLALILNAVNSEPYPRPANSRKIGDGKVYFMWLPI